MTYKEFYDAVASFRNRFQERDLEVYLRTLYQLLQPYKERGITTEQLLTLLETAFSAEAPAFKEEWFSYTAPPDLNVMQKKLTADTIRDKVDRSIVTELSGYEFAEATLLFQIADLRRMIGKQLEDENRYFGVTSETGNSWYNFDPFTYLECGACGLADNSDDEDTFLLMSWETLGFFLEMGRIYE